MPTIFQHPKAVNIFGNIYTIMKQKLGVKNEALNNLNTFL